MVDEMKSDSSRIEISNDEGLEFVGSGLEECVETVQEEVTQKVMKKIGSEAVDSEEVRDMALMSLYREVRTICFEDVLELKVLVKVSEDAGLDEALTKTVEEGLSRVDKWNPGAEAGAEQFSKDQSGGSETVA